MFRTFIAVKIEPHSYLLDLMSLCIERLQDEFVKWVEPENMHLTLKFLGNTSSEQVEKIKEYFENDIKQNSGFSFNLTGLGFFKSGGQPRVIYSGIVDYQELKNLYDQIENNMFQVGFEKDSRKFNPHLTLGRIKSLKNKRLLFDLVEKFRNEKIQMVEVKEVILYQSILKPEGPTYKPLKKVRLNEV